MTEENVFSLDNLKQEMEKEFAPFAVNIGSETVYLSNLMRLGKNDRVKVAAALKEIEAGADENGEQSLDDIDELAEAAEVVLGTVADKGDKLLKALGGDMMLTMKMLQAWSEATNAGEAKGSETSSTGAENASTQTSEPTTDSTS